MRVVSYQEKDASLLNQAKLLWAEAIKNSRHGAPETTADLARIGSHL